jgi:erythromycin esterase-like protein
LRGQLNVGQLLREHFGTLAFNVGCICYQGKVTAAENWDEDFEFMQLNNGMKGSYEELFHGATQNYSKNFGIIFRNCLDNEFVDQLNYPRLERYVGVIYRPDTEKQSHYSKSSLPKEYDSVVYFDDTNYLVPMDK